MKKVCKQKKDWFVTTLLLHGALPQTPGEIMGSRSRGLKLLYTRMQLPGIKEFSSLWRFGWNRKGCISICN